MNPHRQKKEFEAMASKAGVEIVDVQKNKHWKVRVKKNGETRLITISGTTSDHRSFDNVVSYMKRAFN